MQNNKPDIFFSIDDNDLSRPSGVHIIRLLTFVPGQTIVNVTYTPELLLEVGQALGMLDSVLRVRIFAILHVVNTFVSTAKSITEEQSSIDIKCI